MNAWLTAESNQSFADGGGQWPSCQQKRAQVIGVFGVVIVLLWNAFIRVSE